MTLSPRIRVKLEQLQQRHEEVGAMLGDAEVINDRARFAPLAKEFSELEDVSAGFLRYLAIEAELNEAVDLTGDDDPDMRGMARDDADRLRAVIAQEETRLQTLLLPGDPHDRANVFLEIRAGTGGDEAALFAGDLFRMYSRYAENQRWSVEILSERAGEMGGYKEVIARVEGREVYSRLKFESGAHRVQRVPATEAQGRVHTSACTVAVLPEPDEIEDVAIERADLRVDTFRASGAGGQHVNRTDSAIRLTHLPTGIVVECQDERSQHKNRARAMSLLRAKILDRAQSSQNAAQAARRKSLVGSGDRSERIRTYNFQQGRITDHRINLTLYALDDVLQGGLEPVIEPLLREHQAERLSELAEGG